MIRVIVADLVAGISVGEISSRFHTILRTHSLVPPNDGEMSIGQTVVAAARL